MRDRALEWQEQLTALLPDGWHVFLCPGSPARVRSAKVSLEVPFYYDVYPVEVARQMEREGFIGAIVEAGLAVQAPMPPGRMRGVTLEVLRDDRIRPEP